MCIDYCSCRIWEQITAKFQKMKKKVAIFRAF